MFITISKLWDESYHKQNIVRKYVNNVFDVGNRCLVLAFVFLDLSLNIFCA